MRIGREEATDFELLTEAVLEHWDKENFFVNLKTIPETSYLY